jgi:DHA2 family metal-tetracycline-proton antiporter-like MFS transporter
MNEYIITDKSRRFWFILSLSLVHLLLGLDINIVSVSLPTIAEHFGVNAGVVSRIVWIYFLILTCFLLGFGKLGDLKGFKKLYLIGISVFTLGSLLSALAFDFNILVIFRVIQALGGAVLFALTPALIVAYLPVEIRGKVFGINYAFTALGGIIGRGLNGYLIEMVGWNSIFMLNIPIGIIAVLIGLKFIPKAQLLNQSAKYDLKGTIFIFIALLAFLFVINAGQEFGWDSVLIISSVILSILFFVIFIQYERKINNKTNSVSPILKFSVLKKRQISFPIFAFALIYIITNGMIYLFPFYLQWIRDLPKKEIGLLMAIPSLLQMFAGYLSGTLSDKKSIKIICSTGILLTIVSYVTFSFLDSASNYYFVVFSIILYGIAIGVFIPANTNRIMSFAPLDQKGSISSLMTTVIRLGSALGVASFAAIFTSFVPQKNPVQMGVPIDNILIGFKYTFIFGALICILALIINLFVNDRLEDKS